MALNKCCSVAILCSSTLCSAPGSALASLAGGQARRAVGKMCVGAGICVVASSSPGQAKHLDAHSDTVQQPLPLT